MCIVRMDSLDDPALEPYRTLRRPAEHMREGIFVAEGNHVVRRLLESPLEVQSVLVTPQWLARLAAVLAGGREGTVVYLADSDLLQRIVGYSFHQGVMAVGRIPPARPLAAVLADSPHPWLLVALDGVTNAENVGVIARSAAALGASALIAGETAASPWLRRAVRNSMGALFRVPVCTAASLAETLRGLDRERGACVYAAAPDGGVCLYDADLTRDCCLVLGHEGDGVRRAVRDACTGAISIPMAPGVDSLNVASAASVLLAEAARQRRAPTFRAPHPP